MSDSYYRDCKWCGRRIQMRKMPGGQWLAFEGYATQHNCKKPVSKSDRFSSSYNPSSRTRMDNSGIGFKSSDLSNRTFRSDQDEEIPFRSPSTSSSTRRSSYTPSQSRSKYRYSSPTSRSSTSADHSWIIIGIIVVVVICLLSSNCAGPLV